jgi:hypothetical protein
MMGPEHTMAGDVEPGPQDDPVLEEAARALAELVEPDLSTFPETQVWAAMTTVLDSTDPSAGGLGRLRARIHELSAAMTRLEDADKADFSYESKEWGAIYQRLVGLFTERLVIIGRSRPQFLFVPHK